MLNDVIWRCQALKPADDIGNMRRAVIRALILVNWFYMAASFVCTADRDN